MRKRLERVALFFDAAHVTSSEVTDFDEFMSSTSGHSTATMMYWMKKTTNAISDTGRKESVQVALLQTHGEDDAYLLCFSEVWSEFFIGAFLPDVFSEIYQFFFYLSNSSVDGR